MAFRRWVQRGRDPWNLDNPLIDVLNISRRICSCQSPFQDLSRCPPSRFVEVVPLVKPSGMSITGQGVAYQFTLLLSRSQPSIMFISDPYGPSFVPFSSSNGPSISMYLSYRPQAVLHAHTFCNAWFRSSMMSPMSSIPTARPM